MARTQLILATLLLVLTLSLEIQSIEGRHLKFVKKYDIPKLHSDHLVSEKETKQIAGKSIDHKTAYANDSVPSAPMTPMPPSQALGKTQPPPPPPDHVVDFRPTTPGHSPGVGHSIQN